MEEIIYVKLLDEGTEVFRPVKAFKISKYVYKITENNNAGELWEFNQDQLVSCEEKNLENKLVLVAKAII